MKVAAIQMCSSHLVAENLTTAAELIQEAAANQAKLVVLPEMFAMMGMDASDKVAIREPIGHGEIQSFLAEQAKKYCIWIVGGTIPIICKDETKARAASLVFDDLGNRVARYDKIHLFDVAISQSEVYQESNTIEPGDRLIVIDTPVGKLGLAVCYDVRFPELFRCLFNRGTEIIALPSAFTVTTGAAHWKLLARSRAVENFCYVIGACQGGTHTNGRKTYGHSLIVEPWGTVIAEKDDTEPGVIYAILDLEHLNEIRKSIPVYEHQKLRITAKSARAFKASR
jgi:predicted amidohydrolase